MRVRLWLVLLLVITPYLHASTPVASTPFTGGEQGRIVVQVKINGKGPFPFMFDTGSINVLSLELAKQLGISLSGNQKVNAFGGAIETASATIETIQMGDFATSDTVTLPHTQITVIGGGPFTPGGPVGFLGWEFLQHLVVEVDYEHGRLSFYDPTTYTAPGSATRLPITLKGNFIVVPARVYDHAAALELDSGNESSGLVLFPRFVKQNHLEAHIKAVTGYGYGGVTSAMVTRAPTLEIANLSIRKPLTELSLDSTGVESGDLDGNVGAPLLRQFNWIYDVPHKSVYLTPNWWFGKPELGDHSGLVLDTRSGTAQVLFVYPNSPAARAGLKEGDQLSGSDDAALTAQQWHDLLTASPGTIATLRLHRDNNTEPVSLRLRLYD